MSDESPAPETKTKDQSVKVVLSKDWAQAVTRAQQLHNAGQKDFRIVDDEQGRVRIEPGG